VVAPRKWLTSRHRLISLFSTVLAQAGVVDHPMAAAGVEAAAQLLKLSTTTGFGPDL
jgi:hypothetical protein